MEEFPLCILLLLCCGIISAQDWKRLGSCGAGLECGPQCQKLCLSQHNYYRSLHNSPALKCDPNLALSAQAWADANANQKTVQRSTPSNDYVESISWKKWGWKGMGSKLGAIPGAVRSWYSEIKRGYNYDTGTGNGEVTHFKSLIDAREVSLGCGISIRPGDGAYVVARYSLGPGKQFKLNDFGVVTKAVGSRKEPEPQCRLKSFEREQCGDLGGPFVTPYKCLKAGCCYEDIFMDEPGLQWHNPKASIWCFKRKSIVAADVGGSCFANSCYVIAEKGKTWDENQQSCKSQGGDLVSMETPKEWEYINNKIQKITLPMVSEWHIGLKKEGDWKWVNGKPLTIKKWQRGQPSGDGKVAVMSKDYPPGSEGLFNDLDPGYPKPYICEIPKGIPAQPQPSGNPTTAAGGQQGGITTQAAPTVSPSGNPTTAAGGQQGVMTEFEKDCLNAHNEYRAKHGNPPMKWNNQLKEDAQKWADDLAQKDVFPAEHDPNNKEHGENLAYFSMSIPTKPCQGPKTSSCTQCREMVKDWYDEISDYDFNTNQGKPGTVTTHFTQVVWKESTELGMAIAMSTKNFFTVARYNPKGNFGFPVDYKRNVPPLL